MKESCENIAEIRSEKEENRNENGINEEMSAKKMKKMWESNVGNLFREMKWSVKPINYLLRNGISYSVASAQSQKGELKDEMRNSQVEGCPAERSLREGYCEIRNKEIKVITKEKERI